MRRARLAAVVMMLLAGWPVAEAVSQDRLPAGPEPVPGPVLPSSDEAPVAEAPIAQTPNIVLAQSPAAEQGEGPPTEQPVAPRSRQISEPGRSIGDGGEVLPESQRWNPGMRCVEGPAGQAMPITAPDGCCACQRPGCGQGRGICAVLRLFTYCPLQRGGTNGSCNACPCSTGCSACGYFHGAVPVELYMRWPCRECNGSRDILPPCQYPRPCYRCCDRCLVYPRPCYQCSKCGCSHKTPADPRLGN